jgi:hypothetical protein
MCPNVKLKRFNHSEYDTIIFDEIYFSDMRKLKLIYQFVMTNNDKIIIATGDCDQLEPISNITNTYKYETYADLCINKIFQNEIYLHENKRLKTPEDRKLLNNMKQIFLIQKLLLINL